jgi:glutamine amidotransferase
MIAVIEGCGNNLTSIGNALKTLGVDYEITCCPDVIKRASHVILPGVGIAHQAMRALRERELIDVIRSLKQPLLGICVGMQLLFEYSEEGAVECLGLIPGCVKRLPNRKGYPVPHMGWNRLTLLKQESPVLQGINQGDYVYFVHSYAVRSTTHALVSCQYSESFAAMVQYKNVYGMQFHPEKSAETGLLLLKNFVTLEGAC